MLQGAVRQGCLLLPQRGPLHRRRSVLVVAAPVRWVILALQVQQTLVVRPKGSLPGYGQEPPLPIESVAALR